MPGRESVTGSRAPWRLRLVRNLASRRLHSAAPALDDDVRSPGDASRDHHGLLAKVADGDGRAMESCLEAYGPLVWSIVRRRVPDRGAAEDLTQEIFTEVWRTARRYDPAVASESCYIGMIARRRAIDWGRRQQRLPILEALPEREDIPARTETPGAAIDREFLWRALDSLPEETREMFLLHFEQGLSHSEISEKTGQPLGTVKTRMRRGLIEARRLLAERGQTVKPEPQPEAGAP